MGGGGESIIRLELDHRPYGHPHGDEPVFQRLELRGEGGLDPLPRLVAGPERVAERFDDVIGRHADVRGPVLEHLEHGMEDANRRAEGRIIDFSGAPQAVEMAEQLVGAINQVNDHRGPARPHAVARSSMRARSRALRVSDAARSNSTRASSNRPSLNRRSPRTPGRRW